MSTYQATAGQRLYYSTASDMKTKTLLDGITSTPDKGGEPDSVELSIISEKFKRSLTGQQSMDTMTYEFAPDFSTGGNVEAVNTLLKAGEVWFYEEYVVGDDSTLGAGILYKGKPQSASYSGQQGNNAQTASFYVQLTGSSIYVSSGGSTPTYTDLFSGASVTTPA